MWAPRTLEQIDADLRRVGGRVKDCDPDRLLLLILQQKAQVFPLPHGSVVGTLTRDGQAHLEAGAGELGELLEAEPHICAWYREHGARFLTIAGRKGWLRVLTRLGWERHGDDMLSKDIT
jgi:hypothetical protein